MNGRWKATIAVCTLAIPVGGWIAYAENSHSNTRSNSEQIRLLTDLRVKQEIESATRKKLYREQCLTGQLRRDSDICKIALAGE